MLSLFRQQPRPFYMIFMLEIWERFGFYTMQGILVLFFIRKLQLSDLEAYYVFGAFSALVYGMVILGGYLGDKVLGTKRTIVLGLIVLSLGYLAMAFAHSDQIYQALGLICVGTGLFKANPSSLLAKCYQQDDPRLEGGFTLYYMAVNIGAILALLIGPPIASRWGYSYAFFLCFLALIFGLINYYLQRKHLIHIKTFADEQPISLERWFFVFLLIIVLIFFATFLLKNVRLAEFLFWPLLVVVLGIYFYFMSKEDKISAKRMVVALVLMAEAIVFFTLYQQMPTSLNLFAFNNVDPKIIGIPIDPQSFQVLNPIWIVIMSPILAWFYQKMNHKGITIPIPYKFAAGMLSCGLGFCLLFFARYAHNEQGIVASWWLVASYFFQSTGELLVSALGLAMVAELVPRQIAGFVMGMWFLTTSIAGFIGASVASLTALPKHLQAGVVSLTIYTQAFAYIGLVTLGLALLMCLFAAKLSQFIGKN